MKLIALLGAFLFHHTVACEAADCDAGTVPIIARDAAYADKINLSAKVASKIGDDRPIQGFLRDDYGVITGGAVAGKAVQV